MDYTERKEQYKAALMKWKADNNINWYARIPEKPKLRQGEDALEYAKKLCEYNKIVKTWQTAPKPEDFDVSNTLNEHFLIRIGLVLRFGAQHVKLFNFRLLSELDDFLDFLFRQGFRYDYIEKKDGGVEIDIDRSYDFVFSEGSTRFNLAIASADGVHITGFYFYNENGYKDESQRVNTIADMHDFFMKDKRVVTKKIKSEKGCHNFIQDYIAPYEAARIQDDRFYITTIDEYKKLPKYRWPTIKGEWVVWAVIIGFLALTAYSVFIGFSSKDDSTQINTLVDKSVADRDKVYICTSPNARKYHTTPSCRWLDNCSGDIKEVSLSFAETQGKTPCKGCQ